MPLADCLRPFNQSDRHKVQPLINELRQAVGDDHLLGIQTELFDVLVKIVGNFPLSSGSGYFWPGSYIDFSLKLSCIALNLLRQRIQFFTMPLAQKEFETQLLKLLVLTICFFFNLRITAMTFCVAAENGDEFRFEVPYEDWFKEHEGQELTLYHNVDPDPEAAAGNINRLVLKYLPESLQKRFAKSFKRGYLALLSKFIRGDVGSIVKDEFILILISQAESILREQMTTEFARKGEEPPHYIPSILSWAICALLANELSPEAALRKSDAIGNKEPLQIVARAITCKDGEIYAVIEYFFPLLTAKLQELFPRQTWREKEVLRMCCQCGIFDLKEGATFEEVANRIEIYKKCGKEVVSTPVQGLRFNNFLLYVANDSYFGRTVQSLQAKHSVNAKVKAGTANSSAFGKAMRFAGDVTVETVKYIGSPYVYDVLSASDATSGILNMLYGDATSGIYNPSLSFYGFGMTLQGGQMYFTFDPTSFAMSVAVQIALDYLQCEPKEQTLMLKKGQKLCHYVGTYCSKKVVTCVERKESYCCYNSPLARILQEQGRPQLGKGWGSAQNPQCEGFTQDELERLDFDAMDLSEFEALIVQKNELDSAAAQDRGTAHTKNLVDKNLGAYVPPSVGSSHVVDPNFTGTPTAPTRPSSSKAPSKNLKN